MVALQIILDAIVASGGGAAILWDAIVASGCQSECDQFQNQKQPRVSTIPTNFGNIDT